MGQGILLAPGLSRAEAGLIIHRGIDCRILGDPVIQLRQGAGGDQKLKILREHEVQIRLPARQDLLRQPLAVVARGDAADILHLHPRVGLLK